MAEENENLEEQEIVVETEVETEVEAEAPAKQERVQVQQDGDDELDSYSKGVQNRIKKLTEKYRQEERDKAEAVRLSQQLMEENKKLKDRVQNLDSGFLNEYNNRLKTQEAQAKAMYKQAVESGDVDRQLQAQEAISKLAVEKQRYASAKAKADNERVQVQKAEPTPAPQPQAQQQQPPRPDPRAEKWAEKNEWFGNDRVMTTAAFAIHQQLIEEEGFDPMTDEYYSEIDTRMRSEFPHKFETSRKRVEEARSLLLIPPHPAVPNRGAGRSSYRIHRSQLRRNWAYLSKNTLNM